MAEEGGSTASAKCDFSGKFHMNISMEDSAKLALLARPIPLQPPGCEKDRCPIAELTISAAPKRRKTEIGRLS